MKSITHERRKQQSDYLDQHYDRRGHHFSSVLADSALLERFYYDLRYISYIKEARIPFKTDPSLNKVEVDESDANSLKFLLLYKPLHLFLGGNRIILPDEEKDYAGLPTLAYSKALKEIIPEKDWYQTGEVSRFLISKERSQICFEHLKKFDDSLTLRKIEEQKLITLMLTCSQACQKKNLNILIFSLEKALIKLLQKNDILLIPTNEDIEYHGNVQTAVLYFDRALEHIKKCNPALLDFYLSQPSSNSQSEFY
ncbi:Putative lysophospholipid acyltransferase family protein [Candidatus Bealeia paramacronuclearis]|uniref:Lysophospholipid acyltransferase family protein n=1 Tax=Candidatus Bealeia paramacronuclearis TaxID=1921001 RepID=A0ABZ2C8J8_9PROT|nr:putative lysophospholipid acyltransferase family protein [Candidatus Bealeia paramacronuclearis]